jgi:hypothetical protein
MKMLLKMLLVFVLLFLGWWAVSAWFLHAGELSPKPYGECLSRSWWIAALAATFTGLLCLLVWDAGRQIGKDSGPNGG